MLCEYNQSDIKKMSMKAHKQFQEELDRTWWLDKHLNELCARAYTDDAKFQNKNSLYRQSYPREIRIAPSVREISEIIKSIMFDIQKIENDYKDDATELFNRKRELILEHVKPKQVITLTEPIPNNIWWGDTLKGINLRPGLLNNDPSKPYCGFLGGQEVHALFGGDTGEGKSVLCNAVIVSDLYEYPPWELSLWLCDPKMLEFGRYAQAYRCPQIRVVAATQNNDYIVSVYETFNEEMLMLYSISSIFGAQSLQGIRTYLNMCIPRNYIFTDELTQPFATGTTRQVMRLEKAIQSIAKLGRAVGYHMTGASQNYSGTMPSHVMSQFSVGVAVGCDEEVSEALIGNKAAMSLKKKVGYCIFNQKKATKDIGLNKEFKVAFWPDETDEDKIHFQKFLKKVCDTAEQLGIESNMEYFNETNQRNYMQLNEDIDFVKQHNTDINLSNTMCLMPLGAYMKYTGVMDNIAFFNWEYARKNNVFINALSIHKVKYLCQLLADSLLIQRPDAVHTAVIDNSEIFEDYIPNYRKNLTGELDVKGLYSSCFMRSTVLKYNLACQGENSVPSVYGYLNYMYRKAKDEKAIQFVDLLQANLIDSELLDRLYKVFDAPKEDLVDPIDVELKDYNNLASLIKDIKLYTSVMSCRKDTYLKSSDFRPNIYWLFEPLLNEGIVVRGGVIDAFDDLLAIGPTVGVFFIVVTTDARGMKKSLLNARHCITCSPQSVMATYTEEEFTDASGIGYQYQFIEGSDDEVFYFKEYFKS